MSFDSKESPRYPYTYACDYLRIKLCDSQLSRTDASKLRGLIADAIGMDDHELAEKLADRYIARANAIAEAQDDASEESQFLNHYRCPSCQHEWDSQWSATCGDECPNCGASNISPWRSEDL